MNIAKKCLSVLLLCQAFVDEQLIKENEEKSKLLQTN